MAKARMTAATFNGSHSLSVLQGMTGGGGAASAPAEERQLPLALLVPRPTNRKLNSLRVEELKKSIQAIGIQEALIVRTHPSKPGQYEILAGHYRHAAATSLNLETAPVTDLGEVDDITAAMIAAATNLQREGLTDIEETDTILELCAIKLGVSVEGVVQLFYQFKNGTLVDAQRWATIEEVMASAARIKPITFVQHRLPLLKLPEELLIPMRDGRLESSKALAIARIKDEKARNDLLDAVLVDNLPLSQIKAQVQDLVQPSAAQKPQPVPKQFASRLKTAATRFGKMRSLDDSTARKVEKLLQDLENLVGDANGSA